MPAVRGERLEVGAGRDSGCWLAIVVAACLFLSASSLSASDQDGDFAQFMDGVMAGQAQATGRFAGGAIAVVQNGHVLMTKGYGLADIGSGRRVDRNTLFRVGDITKIFAWMSVLQQVEAGRLELDRDVNDYLRTFQLRAGRFQKVTLRHLMTHTAGFEDRLLGLFAPGRPLAKGLGESLAADVPRRLYPPGEVTAYSNYGAGLAAHLVEIGSGRFWQDYVDENVIRPLGLTSTSLRQPLPANLRDRLAVGYRYVDGRYEPQPYEFVQPGPAGSASSSALDMARLMIELLGRRSSGAISLGGKKLMLSRAFTTHPDLNGMTLGLYETGSGSVGHEGDTLWFHALLRLWPEHNLGLFLAFNTEQGGSVRDAVVRTFAGRYGLQETVRPADVGVQLDAYTGYFAPTRKVATGHLKILRLLSVVKVEADRESGELVVRSAIPNAGEVVRYQAHTDSLFINGRSGRRMGFLMDGIQPGDRFYLDDRPMYAFERIDVLERPDVTAGVVGTGLTLNALMLVWPGGWLRRGRSPSRYGARLATLVAVVAGVSLFTFFFGMAWLTGDVMRVMSRTDPTLHLLLWLPVLAAALTLIEIMLAYRSYLSGYWWPRRRLHYVLLVLANAALVGWCFYWRMVPLSFQGWI